MGETRTVVYFDDDDPWWLFVVARECLRALARRSEFDFQADELLRLEQRLHLCEDEYSERKKET